jgi:hypothetical protein
MSDNKELKSCPFCGAEAKVKTRATRMVNCTQCSASTFEPHDDEFGAIKEWNRRAAQPVVLSDAFIQDRWISILGIKMTGPQLSTFRAILAAKEQA